MSLKQRDIVGKSSTKIIIIPGASFPELMFFVFYYMLFHGNGDEMIIDLHGNELGLAASIHAI